MNNFLKGFVKELQKIAEDTLFKDTVTSEGPGHKTGFRQINTTARGGQAACTTENYNFNGAGAATDAVTRMGACH